MPHVTSKCENFSEFLRLHEEQLKASAIPEIFWKSLFAKLKGEVYDAGEHFMIQLVEYAEDCEEGEDEKVLEDTEDVGGPSDSGGTENSQDDVEATDLEDDGPETGWQVAVTDPEGVKATDPEQIYLIDHAWTYRVDQVRQQLTEIPGLLPRMATLMDINMESKSVDVAVEEVFTAMWKFNQTYSIGNANLENEDASPIWYVLDEFGSRIQHSDEPNMALAPFYYVPQQISYSIMWPLKDVEQGEEITRDYIPGVKDTLTRKLMLLPWQPADMTHLSFDLKEPEESFFRKYKIHETLPNPEAKLVELPRDRNIRVYTDIGQVAENLNDSRFELVDNVDEADIIWSGHSMKDFQALSENFPQRRVNQFPFEMVLTVKNLLAAVSRRKAKKKHIDPDTLETSPDWLPVTFNLSTELSQFVSYFQQREERGLQNCWICKPWNLARGLDSHVTDNLNYILRLPDTGPKIACLYVDDPVLIEREEIGLVKFDLRFVVLLISVEPLILCVYNKFLIRYANVPFSMDHFDEYEKHFTVMNCKKGVEVCEVFTEDFIETFEKQYPDFSWEERQADVNKVIQEVFEAAISKPPPQGICHSPQSRAIYGLDIMFKWKTDNKGNRKMVPVVFECNFSPNNARLCKYYPSFTNDIFSVLFLNDAEGRQVTLL